jgi:hypothetical protein
VEAEKTISEITRKVNEFLRKSETNTEMLKLFERGPRFQVGRGRGRGRGRGEERRGEERRGEAEGASQDIFLHFRI